MVARLQFGPDGQPLNRPTRTLAQEIGWHKTQIQVAEGMGPGAINAKSIAYHRREIARLLGQELA
jgi:hypothetical protein